MLTYVTAFYPSRTDVDFEGYFAEFAKIAATGVPVLLFTDPTIGLGDLGANVRVIFFALDLSWKSDNTVLPERRHAQKDSADFMCLMLMKLKCMSEALKYTDASHLAWIDFRVFHVIRDTARVQEKLQSLTRAEFLGDRILAPGCWGPVPSFDMFNAICWRFCGGFLLGPREIFEPAYARQTELVRENLPRLTWEVNYWAQMEEFFEWYPGDHNDSLIMNVPHT